MHSRCRKKGCQAIAQTSTAKQAISLDPGTDLGLSIGPQPWDQAVLANLSQAETKLGCQHVGEGHELLSLVSGVTEHVALGQDKNAHRPSKVK